MRIIALFAFAASLLSLSPTGFALNTVPTVDVSKYLGRWYQVYGNFLSDLFNPPNTTCIAADYGLDEATGNITVINSGRSQVPTGDLITITGYSYGTGDAMPGQRKVHLEGAPGPDGNYWIFGLGPETYGPESLYEWAIVSGSDESFLFVLARDVERFDELFNDYILRLLNNFGFTGPWKEPKRILQEGCLVFDPVTGV